MWYWIIRIQIIQSSSERSLKQEYNYADRRFKQLLEALEEDISGLPFIDILYKLGKLNLLNNAKDWMVLRQTRNTISHEYPFFKEVQIEELNLLPEEVVKLTVIWLKLKEYTLKLFAL